MKSTALVRTLSIILGAAALGLFVGYKVKASPDKGSREKGFSGACTGGSSATLYVFSDGISDSPSGPVNDHHVRAVCVNDQITWHVADPSVSAYHLFFEESPCEGPTTFPPVLYQPSNSATGDITCNVYSGAPGGKVGLRVHKYELFVDSVVSGKAVHRYVDPHVVVAGTGNLQ